MVGTARRRTADAPGALINTRLQIHVDLEPPSEGTSDGAGAAAAEVLAGYSFDLVFER